MLRAIVERIPNQRVIELANAVWLVRIVSLSLTWTDKQSFHPANTSVRRLTLGIWSLSGPIRIGKGTTPLPQLFYCLRIRYYRLLRHYQKEFRCVIIKAEAELSVLRISEQTEHCRQINTNICPKMIEIQTEGGIPERPKYHYNDQS